MTNSDHDAIKRLKRENAELRRANDTLKAAACLQRSSTRSAAQAAGRLPYLYKKPPRE